MPDHAGRLRLYADMREEMGRLVGNDLAGHLRAAADHVVALEAERDRLAADNAKLRAELEADTDDIVIPPPKVVARYRLVLDDEADVYAATFEQRSKDYPGWAAGSTDSSST